MNSTPDRDRTNQQRPASGKSARIHDLVTAADDDGTELWVIDPKARRTVPPAELDAVKGQDTRREREELFGFHPDILRQAGPAPRTLRRATADGR